MRPACVAVIWALFSVCVPSVDAQQGDRVKLAEGEYRVSEEGDLGGSFLPSASVACCCVIAKSGASYTRPQYSALRETCRKMGKSAAPRSANTTHRLPLGTRHGSKPIIVGSNTSAPPSRERRVKSTLPATAAAKWDTDPLP